MKIIICLVLLISFRSVVQAQDYSQTELTRSFIENEKKSIITESMEFTEDESAAFWPVYKDFERESAAIFNRKVDLLNHFATSFGSISDDDALEMVNELIQIQFAEARIKKEYLKKYQKALPGKKVARYYQLENKMAAIINNDLAEIIPLVE